MARYDLKLNLWKAMFIMYSECLRYRHKFKDGVVLDSKINDDQKQPAYRVTHTGVLIHTTHTTETILVPQHC